MLERIKAFTHEAQEMVKQAYNAESYTQNRS